GAGNNTVNLTLTTGQNTGEGTDVLSGIENLVGGDGDDSLIGNTADNQLDGGTGNDTLEGGAGNDTLIGGAGTDTATFGAGNNTVNLTLTTGQNTGEGTDVLSGIENLVGGDGDDSLIGNTADNQLDGGTGNDTLNGGAGNDTLIGGAGTDTAIYAGNFADYTTSGSANNFTIVDNRSGSPDGTDTVENVEFLQFADVTVPVAGIFSPVQLFDNNNVLVGGFTTIQAAINAANANYKILVAPGTYNENLTINKEVQVIGAKAGVLVDADGRGTDESIIGGKVTISAAATLDGFTLTKPESSTSTNNINFSGWGGINLDIGSQGTVTHTIVEAYGAAGGFAGSGFVRIVDGGGTFQFSKVEAGTGYDAPNDARGVGAVAVGGVNGTYTVTENTLLVSTDNADAVNIYGGLNNTVVVTNNTISGTDGGIVEFSFNATTGADNLTITGNIISNYNDNGIRVFNHNKPAIVTIKDNSVTGPNPLLVDTNSTTTYVIGNSAAAALTSTSQLSSILADNAGIETLEAGSYASFVPQNFTIDGLTVIAAYIGNNAPNTLIGNNGANLLQGNGGDDTLDGGTGNDTLEGGAGNDNLEGGAGTDTAIYAGNFADYTTSGSANNFTIVDNRSGSPDGTDTVENVEFLQFADVTVPVAGILSPVQLFDNNNVLIGGFTTIQAAINAAVNGYRIVVGAGSYTENLTVNKSLTILGANAGTDAGDTRGAESVLTGGIHILDEGVLIDGMKIAEGTTISGELAGVYVQGNNATVENTVFHRSGLFSSSRGVITTGSITGLEVSGNSFSGFATGVYLKPGAAGSVSGNSFEDNFVGLSFDTNNPADVAVTGNSFTNNLFEQVGLGILSSTANLLTFGSGSTFTGASPQVSIYGLRGDGQLIIGTGFDDKYSGGAGNDTISGGAGNDTLIGGAGTDTAVFGAGNNTVNLTLTTGQNTGEGTDVLSGIENLVGGDGDDSLTGDTANNQLDGGTGNDTLLGDAGNDTLIGGAGNDSLVGGTGTDTATFGASNNTVNLTLTASQNTGEGTDVLSGIENLVGGDGNDSLTGSAGNNQLDGGDGNDTLTGLQGTDFLDGGTGADSLSGGSGSDTLIGGAGNDTLIGGTTADRFVFNNPTEGLDTITDFNVSEGDAIVVSSAGFGGLTTIGGTLTASLFATAENGTAKFIYSGGILSFDSNLANPGGLVQLATLTNLPVIAATNIQVVA
ncbi:MAG: beta strand repeat-containing protein, partial [bacterium]